MKQYKYIGETDELTTNGKIYNVKANGTFIDDTNTECCLGNDFEKYFELESVLNNNENSALNNPELGNKSKPLLYDVSLLESGNYYRINGTKKKLYWDGEKWMKPQKDSRGSYDGWIAYLEKQPTNFKFAQEISISDLYE